MHKAKLLLLALISLTMLVPFGNGMNTSFKAMALTDDVYPDMTKVGVDYSQYDRFYKDDNFRENYYNYHNQQHQHQHPQQSSYDNDNDHNTYETEITTKYVNDMADYVEDKYQPYSKEPNYKSNYNDNDPIVNIEKKLFVCKDAQDQTDPSRISFGCFFISPIGTFPENNSDRYTECTSNLCPGIDESDFGAQIINDVATIPALSSQGTPVNLDKSYYTVSESDISDRIKQYDVNFVSTCFAAGFDSHSIRYEQATPSLGVEYNICTQYVGDCEGTIQAGEVKTCTIENYIYQGRVIEIPNAASGTTPTGTSATTTPQSNNAITTTNKNTSPTQSSNLVGVSQPSSLGAAAVTTHQTNNIEIPNTLSSSLPSSLLENIR
ncbi:MAG TPA: hypothetical protein VJ697_06245, partial [Nitrososphaeraceae archaeon]|nr:hypothetical protein [Nitrososphaeraceae archaeon]